MTNLEQGEFDRVMGRVNELIMLHEAAQARFERESKELGQSLDEWAAAREHLRQAAERMVSEGARKRWVRSIATGVVVFGVLGAAAAGVVVHYGGITVGTRPPTLVALPKPLRGDSEMWFLGERGELYGWLVERRGEAPHTVYVTDDGHAVLGPLYAPDGTPLSGRQIEEARNPEPAFFPPPVVPLETAPGPDTETGEAGP